MSYVRMSVVMLSLTYVCACLLAPPSPHPRAEDFTPVEVPQPSLPEVPVETPPYTGFQIGSEEDSLANCLDLIPKPPKRDFIKFMEKDRWVSVARSTYVCCGCGWEGRVQCSSVSSPHTHCPHSIGYLTYVCTRAIE